jgi:hypothetical protein
MFLEVAILSLSELSSVAADSAPHNIKSGTNQRPIVLILSAFFHFRAFLSSTHDCPDFGGIW